MNIIYKKTLVIGIILQLVGVSVSSAMSVDNKPVISTDESEECSECEELCNAELDKVKHSIKRLEVYSKLLLVLSRHNPELMEISWQLYIHLSNINQLYAGFNTIILQKDEQPICSILEPLYVIVFVIYAFSY